MITLLLQDVSHILASTFRDLYTRDVMGKDVVKNLMTSSEGSNEFHKKCMRQLKLVSALTAVASFHVFFYDIGRIIYPLCVRSIEL